jgi:hypothetical protein
MFFWFELFTRGLHQMIGEQCNEDMAIEAVYFAMVDGTRKPNSLLRLRNTPN